MTDSLQQALVDVARGASRLQLAPQWGGRLLSWRIGEKTVIYWPERPDWNNVPRVRGGNPLLFPFLGRHRVDGRLGEWRDAQGTVRELPMHGFARDLPFSHEVDADRCGVHMTLTDTETTRVQYPFAFRFEVAYRLVEEHVLEVTLSTANLGGAPLPYYAGHHFYFALPHALRGETTLTLPPTARRRQREDGSISAPEPGATHYMLDDPLIHARFHCLQDVPATPVQLECPALGRRIEIELDRPSSVPWYAVTTWTETDTSDFYCVEPWLGLPDAIHNGLGLRWLEPGQTETASLRIRVSDLA